MNDAVAERLVPFEAEVELHIVGQCAQAAAHDLRNHKELEFLDQSGPDRGGGDGRPEDLDHSGRVVDDLRSCARLRSGIRRTRSDPMSSRVSVEDATTLSMRRQRRANSCSAGVQTRSSGSVSQYCINSKVRRPNTSVDTSPIRSTWMANTAPLGGADH